MKRFMGPFNDSQVLQDIRDILWFMVSVQTARADPEGSQTQVRNAIAEFAERRREDTDVEA